MGFRVGSYAKVWTVDPKTDTNTAARISISRKNKKTGAYEQDFSGYVNFIGTVTAKRAANLKEGDRIKLGDVDVTTSYNAEKKLTYTNYKVFDFTIEEAASDTPRSTEPQQAADDGELDDSRLPF